MTEKMTENISICTPAFAHARTFLTIVLHQNEIFVAVLCRKQVYTIVLQDQRFSREKEIGERPRNTKDPTPPYQCRWNCRLQVTTSGVFCRCYCVCPSATPPMWLAKPLPNVVGIGNRRIRALQMQLRVYMYVHARASDWRCERSGPRVGTDR